MHPTIKKTYDVFPFKRDLFLLLKKFWYPSENVYKHLHFHGIFEVEVGKNVYFKIVHYGFHLENEIFWDGLEKGHESISYSLWKPLAKKSRVIFDIGANTGIYSLIAQSINPNAEVFAFEPVMCANLAQVKLPSWISEKRSPDDRYCGPVEDAFMLPFVVIAPVVVSIWT